MRRTLALVAIVLPLCVTTACQYRPCRPAAPVLPAPSDSAPLPAHPATVTALRYRTWISTQAPRNFNAGYWQEALWFPDWKLSAIATPKDDRGPPVLNVFQEDWPRANTVKGAAWVPTGGDPREPYKGPTERVEVPWDLAQRIRAVGELRARLDRDREAIGPDLAASGLLREVKEDDTRQ